MAKVIGSVLRVWFLACLVHAQMIPDNPCPELFSYRWSNGGYYYGQLVFPNDYSGTYVLNVNMSIPAYIYGDANIQVELVTSIEDLQNGESPVYNIYFPTQYVLPKPTLIVFNGQVRCSGPPEPTFGISYLWSYIWSDVGTVQRRRQSTEDRTVQRTPQRQSQRIRRPPTIYSTTTTKPYVYSQTYPTQPVYQTRAPTTTTTTTTTTTSAPVIPVIPRFPSADDQCGYTSRVTHDRIFGGEKTNSEDYPWLTAIMYRLRSSYLFRCGGTLVSDRHVVTAAHCVLYINALLNPLEDWVIVLGKSNIENWANQAVIRDVSDINTHPEYNQTADYDVAVITLSTKVVFDATVRPACLWNEPENREAIVGVEGTVVGWGRDESGAESVNQAKRVVLPIIDQEECLRSNAAFLALTSKRTFCAGRQDGAGPCTGDSGGGFVMQRNGRWTLRGVVSTSLALQDGRTCDVYSYFVFADVAKLTSWIKSITDDDPRPLL